MKRLFCAKPLVATAIALGAVAAASVAHARSDVVFSVGVNVPGGYVQPAPVYVQPAPVYVQPRPVYVQPQPIYVQPRAYYGHSYPVQRSGPYGDWDRDGVANRFDRDSRWSNPRAPYHHGGRRDADGDGVPNRADRAPHNPYRY
jgi:hypothetical protein